MGLPERSQCGDRDACGNRGCVLLTHAWLAGLRMRKDTLTDSALALLGHTGLACASPVCMGSLVNGVERSIGSHEKGRREQGGPVASRAALKCVQTSVGKGPWNSLWPESSSEADVTEDPREGRSDRARQGCLWESVLQPGLEGLC